MNLNHIRRTKRLDTVTSLYHDEEIISKTLNITMKVFLKTIHTSLKKHSKWKMLSKLADFCTANQDFVTQYQNSLSIGGQKDLKKFIFDCQMFICDITKECNKFQTFLDLLMIQNQEKINEYTGNDNIDFNAPRSKHKKSPVILKRNRRTRHFSEDLNTMSSSNSRNFSYDDNKTGQRQENKKLYETVHSQMFENDKQIQFTTPSDPSKEYSLLSTIQTSLHDRNYSLALKIIQWRKQILAITTTNGWIIGRIVAENTMKTYDIEESDLIEANLLFFEKFNRVDINKTIGAENIEEEDEEILKQYENDLLSALDSTERNENVITTDII